MSGFDEWGSQSDFDFQQNGGSGSSSQIDRPGSGGWHWLLSLIAMITVFLLSMGMAYLTRNVDERPVWMMGLIFMVPTAALMLAAMLVESATSAMTPGTSRRPQRILAIAATLATFVVACICDLIYLQGFKKPLAPAQSIIETVDSYDRIILVHDSTASMQENGAHDQEITTMETLLNELMGTGEAGFVSAQEKYDFQQVNDQYRARILQTAGKKPESGRVYYADLLDAGLKMVEEAGINGRTRIIFFTDGTHPWDAAGSRDLLDRCLKDQVSVSCVLFGDSVEKTIEEYAKQTGGMVVKPGEARETVQGLQGVRFNEEVAAAEVQKEIRLQQDLIRNRDTSAVIITCIMLILEGLSLGICLSLMLSVTGQFRVQYIISPIMGVLAFFLLKMVWSQENMAETWWIKEGLSFSLLGVVVMARNRRPGTARSVNYGSTDDADTSFYGTDQF